MSAASRHRSSPIIAVGVLIGIFLATALPLILMRYSAGRAAEDQNKWHLPVIRQFAREWPHPNLRDYGSATTPGYHLTLAIVSRIIGSTDERLLRCLSLAFTIALLATLAAVASRRGTMAAIILCLPVVTSLYFFSSGVWLLPDNAGWLGVLLAMMLALRRRVDVWTYLGSAILITLLVLIRQIDLWVAAPICVSAWLGSGRTTETRGRSDAGTRREADSFPASPRPRVSASSFPASAFGRVALALVTVIPAIVILCIFFHLWHGLVPPAFNSNRAHDIPGAGEHTGGNPAAVALVLATFALFSPFYFAWLPSADTKSESVRSADPTQYTHGDSVSCCHAGVWLGLIAGCFAGVLPHTSYDMAAGRWSGLWRIARIAPAIADRSTAIALLSTIGGGILGFIFSRLPQRDRWIFLTSWLAFCAAQLANRQAWQRYIDPFVLITLILMASRAGRSEESPDTVSVFPMMRGLPIILAAFVAAITIAALK